MKFKDFLFVYNDKTIKGDIVSSDIKPEVLILHGAGTAFRGRYLGLRELLAKEGLPSVAIDYIGHGETGGELHGSSLKERSGITLEAVNMFKDSITTLIGSSMGAYTAIKLCETYSTIKNLILFVPAIYSDESYTIPFGPKFTEAIKKPNSWMNSQAWDILQKFTGNLLIVAAENDNVIPKELLERIYSSAINAKSKELYTIEGASHSFTRYLAENPEQLKTLADKIINFLKI